MSFAFIFFITSRVPIETNRASCIFQFLWLSGNKSWDAHCNLIHSLFVQSQCFNQCWPKQVSGVPRRYFWRCHCVLFENIEINSTEQKGENALALGEIGQSQGPKLISRDLGFFSRLDACQEPNSTKPKWRLVFEH
jgi:hypothetical protein